MDCKNCVECGVDVGAENYSLHPICKDCVYEHILKPSALADIER
jgi:hypothetical protein